MFLVLYLLGVHALAGFYVYERFVAPRIWTNDAFTADVKSPTGETPVPTIIPAIENETANSPENTANSAVNTNQNFNSNYNQSTAPISPADPGALIIPVAGVNPAQLADTFSDARSDNRVHDAIDIMAPAGTPVLAVGDGEIAKFFDSERGGITIYQYSADKKYVYYYAHLQKRADDVAENQYVARGRIIGYVGDTGNAGPGNYHLHFSIALLRDPKRYWEGEYINPFPLLKNGGAAR
ncbi:MAG TPA: M23 family metallopeptidase [Pyrinomonadaceae bacterium]